MLKIYNEWYVIDLVNLDMYGKLSISWKYFLNRIFYLLMEW